MMVNKTDFYMSLTEEQQRDGWIKFNISTRRSA